MLWGDFTTLIHCPASLLRILPARLSLFGGELGSPAPKDCRAPQRTVGFRSCVTKSSPDLQKARNLWACHSFCQPSGV